MRYLNKLEVTAHMSTHMCNYYAIGTTVRSFLDIGHQGKYIVSG